MPDLTWLSAAVNFIASLGTIWIMQIVTHEAGWRSFLEIIKGCHRLALAILALALFANAGATLYEGTQPRPIDFAAQLALLLVIVFSAVRHRMVPRP